MFLQRHRAEGRFRALAIAWQGRFPAQACGLRPDHIRVKQALAGNRQRLPAKDAIAPRHLQSAVDHKTNPQSSRRLRSGGFRRQGQYGGCGQDIQTLQIPQPRDRVRPQSQTKPIIVRSLARSSKGSTASEERSLRAPASSIPGVAEEIDPESECLNCVPCFAPY